MEFNNPQQGEHGLTMSLYNDLKTSEISVLKKTSQHISAVFCFKKELDLFNGHFPGNPILPGIFQVEMVKYAMEKTFDTGFYIKSVKKTKFSNLIHPGETVCIDITANKEENSRFNVRAILRVGDTIAGKINMVITEK